MALSLLWTADALLAGAGSAQSPWIDVRHQEDLRVARNVAGGAYAFEIDWSRDGGATVDFTEAVATAEDDQVSQPIAAAWARFRVRNTDSVAAFTAHRTNVHARG